MNTYVEFHVLRSFPPSNLNRDDLGSPKTAIFGGVRRLRISSQCLKRSWRTSEQFRGAFAEDQLGVRTARLPDEVLKQISKDLDGPSREGLMALLASIGTKSNAKNTANSDDGGDDEGTEDSSGNDGTDEDTRTKHLLFLSRQEIDAVAEFARDKTEQLSKVFNKKKPDSKAIDKLRKEMKEHLERSTLRNAVDVGVFGRFVTSDEFDTIDGALSVAHGLGTQAVDVEYDYFTAVDDLGESTGAGHLGESEFASSVMYLYACCDLGQLESNLGIRTAAGRKPDKEATALARRGLPAVVRAMAEATPKGKKTGTAPYTPAEYIEVVVRRRTPLSYANAFIAPLASRRNKSDVMMQSIEALAGHRDGIEIAYGRGRDVFTRLVLSLKEGIPAPADGVKVKAVKTIDELDQALTVALDVLAKESEQ